MSNDKVGPFTLRLFLSSGAAKDIPFDNTSSVSSIDAMLLELKANGGMQKVAYYWDAGFTIDMGKVDGWAFYETPKEQRNIVEEINLEALKYWKKQNKIINRGDEWMGEG